MQYWVFAGDPNSPQYNPAAFSTQWTSSQYAAAMAAARPGPRPNRINHVVKSGTKPYLNGEPLETFPLKSPNVQPVIPTSPSVRPMSYRPAITPLPGTSHPKITPPLLSSKPPPLHHSPYRSPRPTAITHISLPKNGQYPLFPRIQPTPLTHREIIQPPPSTLVPPRKRPSPSDYVLPSLKPPTHVLITNKHPNLTAIKTPLYQERQPSIQKLDVIPVLNQGYEEFPLNQTKKEEGPDLQAANQHQKAGDAQLLEKTTYEKPAVEDGKFNAGHKFFNTKTQPYLDEQLINQLNSYISSPRIQITPDIDLTNLDFEQNGRPIPSSDLDKDFKTEIKLVSTHFTNPGIHFEFELDPIAKVKENISETETATSSRESFPSKVEENIQANLENLAGSSLQELSENEYVINLDNISFNDTKSKTDIENTGDEDVITRWNVNNNKKKFIINADIDNKFIIQEKKSNEFSESLITVNGTRSEPSVNDTNEDSSRSFQESTNNPQMFIDGGFINKALSSSQYKDFNNNTQNRDVEEESSYSTEKTFVKLTPPNTLKNSTTTKTADEEDSVSKWIPQLGEIANVMIPGMLNSSHQDIHLLPGTRSRNLHRSRTKGRALYRGLTPNLFVQTTNQRNLFKSSVELNLRSSPVAVPASGGQVLQTQIYPLPSSQTRPQQVASRVYFQFPKLSQPSQPTKHQTSPYREGRSFFSQRTALVDPITMQEKIASMQPSPRKKKSYSDFIKVLVPVSDHHMTRYIPLHPSEQ